MRRRSDAFNDIATGLLVIALVVLVLLFVYAVIPMGV